MRMLRESEVIERGRQVLQAGQHVDGAIKE